MSGPETLDEALKVALRVEGFRVIRKINEQRYGDIIEQSMNQGQSASEQVVNDNDQSCFRSESEIVEAVKSAMEEQLKEFTEELESIQRNVDLLDEQNGVRKPVSARKKRGVVCFNCDKAGHVAKVCPWFMKGTRNKVDSERQIVEYRPKDDKVRSCKVSTKTKPRYDKVGGMNSRQVVVISVVKDVEVKVEKGVKLALQKRKSPSRQARAWKVKSS